MPPTTSLPAQPARAKSADFSAAVRARIVRQARPRLFREGYGALTMDALAADLGMSKKTLYVHFPSKRELCAAVIDQVAEEIRDEADTLLRDPRLEFLEKLRGFAQGMAERFGPIGSDVLAELQRLAPDLHRHLEKVRAKNIPYVFGRLIEEGQLAGVVRDDVTPAFAAEFHLHAMQGMMHPDTQRRLGLTMPEIFDRALRLLFGGLLTPAGRKDYEKLFAR